MDVRIKNAIQSVVGKCGLEPSRKVWTKAVISELGECAGELLVYPSKGCSGWLVDLCWSRGEFEAFSGLALACECEWDSSAPAIETDFQKLLVVEADQRLMIFQYHDDPRRLRRAQARNPKILGLDELLNRLHRSAAFCWKKRSSTPHLLIAAVRRQRQGVDWFRYTPLEFVRG